jgi:hypothetical protein
MTHRNQSIVLALITTLSMMGHSLRWGAQQKESIKFAYNSSKIENFQRMRM